MQLEQVMHYNDLSPKFRKELEDRIKSYGNVIRYKFDIAKPNPDPARYNGETVWPNKYTLTPTVWNIIDPHENREGKQKSKKIGLVDAVDEKGLPNRFRKIRVEGVRRGQLVLDIANNQDDLYTAMALELHPKLKGGQFADKNSFLVVSRIDAQAEATEARKLRTAKVKALNTAEEMSDKDAINFADAMMWDSTEDMPLLRNRIEELAETTPDFFNDLVSGKSIEYQAVIQKALNNRVIAFDPAEYKFVWASNQQLITVLSPSENKTHVEKMGEWLQTGGQKADEVYKKIKGLLNPVKTS